ncbi:testis-expressed protein 47 isoform X1 [Pseudoliparis swirei]|uniref:testis-expressed protein 47 isoform X1 n=1 Tax=Pseudoliparis swirei TaxID=2059687 RepID=UPI0024BED108|nr:testis-expressed protein 47 isoform X1 [Pseudoliparis swirei]
MASQRSRNLSLGNTTEDDNEENPATMFDVFHREMRERIVLQRLIVIARLPHDLDDRTEPGAHYEKLNFQLSKQYILDPMTGLLLVYPSCLLHVIESSRDVLVSVLKDMQQPDGAFMEAPKVVFLAHDPQSRLFPKWSHKVLDADQWAGVSRGGEEEEESTESLVCAVLSALQTLGERLEASQKVCSTFHMKLQFDSVSMGFVFLPEDPGAMLDEAPELVVSQTVLHKLLTRDELQTPRQHLQMYNSPINICASAGRVARSSCLATV